MTKEQIKKKYDEMLKSIPSHNIAPDRVNWYVCESIRGTGCGHKVKTTYRGRGVTPMFLTCEKCQEMMRSTMGKDLDPNAEPTIEWYRPSVDEIKEHELHHVLNGGLLYRTIKN